MEHKIRRSASNPNDSNDPNNLNGNPNGNPDDPNDLDRDDHIVFYTDSSFVPGKAGAAAYCWSNFELSRSKTTV